jgi:hypothetical protein
VGLWRYNSDGIDLCNSQDIHVHDCFVRAFDDCIVLKGLMSRGRNARASFTDRPVKGILVERCVCWNDWGRALEIGAETSTPEIANVVFRDCDVIRADYIAMDIQHGHRANVHDIRFENIRVEADDFNLRPVMQKARDEKYPLNPKDDWRPYAMYIIIAPNSWSPDPLSGIVRNVLFKDISVTSKLFLPSHFQGARSRARRQGRHDRELPRERQAMQQRRGGAPPARQVRLRRAFRRRGAMRNPAPGWW